MRYFAELVYKGTNYHGWQIQPNAMSVQEKIETTLSTILNKKIKVVGCGRTDTGVHASQYFLHFKTDVVWDFDPVFRLNKILPTDIVVFDCFSVKENAHAQHDATARTYEYFIHFDKDPFLEPLSSLYEWENLKIDAMKAATALLTQYQDYYAFCKRPELYKHTLCQISQANLDLSTNGKRLRFRVTGDRFLHGMVRLIVGNLLEVGKGKLMVKHFEQALKNRQAFRYFNAAYPQGLYLAKVEYPYFDMEMKSEMVDLLNMGFGNGKR